MCYNGCKQREAMGRLGADLKTAIAVRIIGWNSPLYEVGIVSNRKSARYGEYFWGLVHTARHVRGVGSARSYVVSFLEKKKYLVIVKITNIFNLKGSPSDRRTHNRDEVVTR
jgi:hypothetical protein